MKAAERAIRSARALERFERARDGLARSVGAPAEQDWRDQLVQAAEMVVRCRQEEWAARKGEGPFPLRAEILADIGAPHGAVPPEDDVAACAGALIGAGVSQGRAWKQARKAVQP